MLEERPSGLSVLPYTDGDLDPCRALWIELTDWHRKLYDCPTIGGEDPGSQFDEHLRKVGPASIWVARLDGGPAGFVGLIQDGREGELEPIVVSPRFRGRGIGHALAREVIDQARARGVRQLSVRPVARNVSAIRFFHELGFDILGHLELFMDFGGDNSRTWRPEDPLAGRMFRV